jgi:hypothetical protein
MHLALALSFSSSLIVDPRLDRLSFRAAQTPADTGVGPGIASSCLDPIAEPL